jgi:hypothetical protein
MLTAARSAEVTPASLQRSVLSVVTAAQPTVVVDRKVDYEVAAQALYLCFLSGRQDLNPRPLRRSR